MVNTNRLIKYYKYCQTGKTGFTDEAGYCLSSTARKDNLNLTCVVLGCNSPADRFTDSVNLYNYGFANYTSTKIIDSSLPLEVSLQVKLGKEDSLALIPANDYYLTTKKGESPLYSIEFNLPQSTKAPICQGDVVGTINVLLDGESIATIDILAVESIEKQSYKDIVKKIVEKFAIIN